MSGKILNKMTLSTSKAEYLDTEGFEAEDQPVKKLNDYLTETRPWYKVPHLRALAFHVFVVTLSATNNGFDGSMLNALQSLVYWRKYMGYPSGYILGALSAAPAFGAISSFLFSPYLADRYGRRFVLVAGQFIALIGAILQGVSNSYAFFFVSRFIIGFGGGISGVGGPALIAEISYPTHREVCTFALNICWYLGAILAAVITYFTRNIESSYSWRIPSFLQGFFPVVQIILMYWVPESPRYFVAKGNIPRARQILSKIHTGNSTDPKDLELVEYEISEIEAALEAEKSAGANSRYSDFFKRKSYRKRLFLVIFTSTMTQLSGNALFSYYLSPVLDSIGITDSSRQLLINMCLTIFNFAVSAAVCSVCWYFRRRTLFNTCVFGMLFTYVVWTALSAVSYKRQFQDQAVSRGVLAMIFLYYLFYDIGANGLPNLYMTEILPYSHRSKGIVIFQLWTAVIALGNAFGNPSAIIHLAWKYYIVYCCVLAVECVVFYFFYPETSGRSLEEVAEVFGDYIEPINRSSQVEEVYSIESNGKPNVEHIDNK